MIHVKICKRLYKKDHNHQDLERNKKQNNREEKNRHEEKEGETRGGIFGKYVPHRQLQKARRGLIADEGRGKEGLVQGRMVGRVGWGEGG